VLYNLLFFLSRFQRKKRPYQLWCFGALKDPHLRSFRFSELPSIGGHRKLFCRKKGNWSYELVLEL